MINNYSVAVLLFDARFELWTFALQVQRSTPELQGHM